MTFELLDKAGLQTYLNSAAFANEAVLPITPWRGLSHLANPRIDEDDILLILAREKGVLIGYLGILPDLIFHESEQKMGWLSSLWVEPAQKGKDISTLLFQKAAEVWHGHLIAANYVPFTKKIYDRVGAFEKVPLTRHGMRYYYRSDLKTILKGRSPVWEKYGPALGMTDQIFNFLNAARLRLLPKSTTQVPYEVVHVVDQEAGRFIDGFQSRELFRRGQREWNWMLAQPWVRSQKERDEIDVQYFFSSTADLFRYSAIKIRDEKGVLSGFMILLLRDGMLSVPACYVAEKSASDAAQLINHFARIWNVSTLTIFRKELLAEFAKHRFPWMGKKVIQRNYMVSTSLAPNFDLQQYNMQDGDGDVGFT